MTATAEPSPRNPTPIRIPFPCHPEITLAARLDLPSGPAKACALLVHGYTCSMDLAITRRIAEGLAGEGISVLRFDLPGHGRTEGVAFADTNFSDYRGAVLAVVEHMRANLRAPTILVGHSLGGAALLAAASEIPEAKAIATIGTPADVGEVVRLIGASPQQVRADGEAEVVISGFPFRIRRQFLDDAAKHRIVDGLGELKKALLVMHAPRDEIVGIDNAKRIYAAAKHPKSFVSLDGGDHLLTDPADAAYAARVIAAWASRYLPADPPHIGETHTSVTVAEIGQGRYANTVTAGRHRLFADEPLSVGGDDLGPGPYDYLSIALAACKSMTLRMYAQRKGLALGRISVEVRHGKVPVDHCDDCGDATEGRAGKIDRFECTVSIEGDLAPDVRDKIVEIAGKCPVHRTLHDGAAVVTRMAGDGDG